MVRLVLYISFVVILHGVTSKALLKNINVLIRATMNETSKTIMVFFIQIVNMFIREGPTHTHTHIR